MWGNPADTPRDYQAKDRMVFTLKPWQQIAGDRDASALMLTIAAFLKMICRHVKSLL
jgi:hypothetical protein